MVGLTDPARFQRFTADVERTRRALVGLLEDLHHAGKQSLLMARRPKGTHC